ncbi:hypothetical protein [Sphingobium cupriresistens]|uniref:hypothetical protein n=1 Tax=Sphingobium cupriresistens TaxID=1132417 RepID=UPI003BF5F2D4
MLGNSNAQHARAVKLEDGTLAPLRAKQLVETLPAPAQTIYLNGDDWLSWALPVNVAPAPIAANRLYITGDGAPKILANGDTYALAVPAPLAAPAVSLVSGTPDPDLSSTILYCYTWVTAFDEESEPSVLSNALLWSPGHQVNVTGFSAVPAGRAINRMRIYRSQTSALGETILYLIHERAAAPGDFLDDVDANPIEEQLPSVDYNPPPAGLTGLVAMPNGMMAAFVGKSLYFCEPYRPHAWPEKYILSADYEIVGLGVFGSSLAVMTTGQPYIVSGTAPDTMSMEKLELSLPCVAARGIVDLGFSVAYPSPDGLVVISSSGAQLVSRNLITRDQWQRLVPSSFVAGLFSGRYLASYDADGDVAIIVIDLTGEQPFITRSPEYADAMFTSIETGALYLLQGDDIYEWDAISAAPGSFLWRSKKFVQAAEINFGAFLVEGVPAAGAPALSVKILADGVQRATVQTMNSVVRLPGGFLARTWEIEIESNCQVTALALGFSPTDLAG